jgi:hypothetical protein
MNAFSAGSRYFNNQQAFGVSDNYSSNAIASNASNSLQNQSGIAVPIPYAKVIQSSDYAPFRGFEPYFANESRLKPSLPWPVSFWQDLTADKNGHISAPTMFGRIWVGYSNTRDINGYLKGTTEFPLKDGQSATGVLYLKKSGAIVGKVFDEKGHSLPGVLVHAFGVGWTRQGDEIPNCELDSYDTTGYDGTFVLQNNISDCHYKVTAQLGDYSDYGRTYLYPDFANEVKVLQAKGSLPDQLESASFLSSNSSSSTTDFRNDTPYSFNGTIPLRFKDPEYQRQELYNSTTIDVQGHSGQIVHVNITLAVEPNRLYSGSISGRLVDEQGNPIFDATVAVKSHSYFAGQTTTDMAGYFTIRGLKAGQYYLDIQPLERDFVVQNITGITVEGGKMTRVPDIILLKTSIIGGKVMLADGTPVPGLFMGITPVQLERGYEGYAPCMGCIASISYDPEFDRRGTDGQGRYAYAKDLPPGIYNVTINLDQVTLGDKVIELEPKSLIVDTRHNRVVNDANLTLGYKVKEDFATLPHIRFYGYVRDNEGNPIPSVTILARTMINGTIAQDYQTSTDHTGFYSLYILQKDLPRSTNSDWQIMAKSLDATAPQSRQDIYMKSPSDWNNIVFYNDSQASTQASVGDEKNIDFTLQKFTAKDILTSKIDVYIRGEPAKFSLPTKKYLFSTDYLGQLPNPQGANNGSNIIAITTNSTIEGVWLDTINKTIIVQVDPIANTTGTMDIEMPNSIASGIGDFLLDGQTYSANNKDTYQGAAKGNVTASLPAIHKYSNSINTTISLTYHQDFEKMEIMAAQVTPEFSSSLVTSIMLAVVISGVVGITFTANKRFPS